MRTLREDGWLNGARGHDDGRRGRPRHAGLNEQRSAARWRARRIRRRRRSATADDDPTCSTSRSSSRLTTSASRTASTSAPFDDTCATGRARHPLGRSRWEIIFVDDGSNDGSFDELARVRRRTTRGRAALRLRTQSRQGGGARGRLPRTRAASVWSRWTATCRTIPREIPRMLARSTPATTWSAAGRSIATTRSRAWSRRGSSTARVALRLGDRAPRPELRASRPIAARSRATCRSTASCTASSRCSRRGRASASREIAVGASPARVRTLALRLVARAPRHDGHDHGDLSRRATIARPAHFFCSPARP